MVKEKLFVTGPVIRQFRALVLVMLKFGMCGLVLMLQ